MALDDPMQRVRGRYLSSLAETPANEFRPLPTGPPLADRAYFASLGWCDRVFRMPVNAPGDKRQQHTYHVGRPGAPLDILRHQLTVDSMPVRVDEVSSMFAVFVPAASFSANDPAGKAAQAADLLLKLEAPATFKPIAADPDRRSYSTNPDLDPLANGEWQRRIDAIVLGAELALVVYKVTLDDMMTIVSEPADWFSKLRQAK